MACDHMNITNREIPQELLSAAKGGKVELTMEDRRNEDYSPPKPKMVAFSGEGHTLGKLVVHHHLSAITSLIVICNTRDL